MTDKEIKALEKRATKFGGFVVADTTFIGKHSGVLYFEPTYKGSETSGFGLTFLIGYSNGAFEIIPFEKIDGIMSLLQSRKQSRGQ